MATVKASTWVGVIMLLAVVAVVLVSTAPHAAAGPTTSPTPSVTATAAHATPATTPESWDVATGAVAHTALLSWLVALTILPFVVLVAIALVGRHRAKLPTQDWRIPYRAPEFPRVLDAHVRTSFPPVPQTYSPSLHIRNDPGVEVEAPTPALAGPMLSAQQAIDMPGVVYGQRLDTGEPLVEQRVLSLAIGGRPGSGKTSTALLLGAQYARMGAELRVADPHSGHPGSLVTQLEPVIGSGALGWVAETPRESLMLVEQVAEQLERRKHGWRHHNGSEQPIVVFLDEFAESLRLLRPHDREKLLDLVQVLGYGGRKYGVCCVLLAQSWLTGSIGTSGVRNPLRAAVVHAMRADEGRALTGLRAEGWPEDPSTLEPGQAFVLGVGASGLIKVRVPLLEPPTRAPARARGGFEGAVSAYPPRTLPALPAEGSERVDGDLREGGPENGQEAEIIRLFTTGLGYPEIIRAVYDRPAGERFKRAREEVEAVVRRALKGDER